MSRGVIGNYFLPPYQPVINYQQSRLYNGSIYGYFSLETTPFEERDERVTFAWRGRYNSPRTTPPNFVNNYFNSQPESLSWPVHEEINTHNPIAIPPRTLNGPYDYPLSVGYVSDARAFDQTIFKNYFTGLTVGISIIGYRLGPHPLIPFRDFIIYRVDVKESYFNKNFLSIYFNNRDWDNGNSEGRLLLGYVNCNIFKERPMGSSMGVGIDVEERYINGNEYFINTTSVSLPDKQGANVFPTESSTNRSILPSCANPQAANYNVDCTGASDSWSSPPGWTSLIAFVPASTIWYSGLENEFIGIVHNIPVFRLLKSGVGTTATISNPPPNSVPVCQGAYDLNQNIYFPVTLPPQQDAYLRQGYVPLLSPNPAHGSLTVSHTQTIYRVDVLNLQGQLISTTRVSSTTAKGSVEIDLSSLPAGPYILKVYGVDNRVYVHRVAKL